MLVYRTVEPPRSTSIFEGQPTEAEIPIYLRRRGRKPGEQQPRTFRSFLGNPGQIGEVFFLGPNLSHLMFDGVFSLFFGVFNIVGDRCDSTPMLNDMSKTWPKK